MKKTIVILAMLSAFVSCKQKEPLFREVPSTQSNLDFNNEIRETDQLNVVNYEYLYNGGGVGIGDFNNDSLPDIMFTGNLVPSKLYINRGNLQFEDITDLAGISTGNKWCKGVSIVDINNDGMMDIYLSTAVLNPAGHRKNLLYVCQRIDPVLKLPLYKEMGAQYGLDDSSHTHMASFFDYDQDGDLDLYLLVNELNEKYPNEFRPIKNDGSMANTDRLLRNDWNDSMQHPVFTDVSKEAGISWEGYGLGLSTSDVNGDGWKDIYVSNDYLSNNELYINNRNGTFTNQVSTYFKHTSRNAMGNDIADLNNDGLPDIIELDMAPADNYRLKKMNNPINYANFQNSAKFGYQHQYIRNMLQVNQGPRPLPGDSAGAPVFSETGYFSGIAQTDWSWAPLAIDADNDGWRDILITNGLPKDMSDLDFMSYRDEARNKTPMKDVLKQLPSVKIANYIYRNNHDLTFSDKSAEWGWSTPTFSAGMAYADFDRDGDMDVVINNTNMKASLLENTLRQSNKDSSNYLQVQLNGPAGNRHGIGATIHLYGKGLHQVYEMNPYRGYLSTVENIAHFGLQSATGADSLVIYWPGNRAEKLTNISANQRLKLDYRNSRPTENPSFPTQLNKSLFSDATQSNGIEFTAGETDFIDFSIQRLIPHKLSQYGPSLATADVNGDGLDDLLVGGCSPQAANLYLQQPSGTFKQKTFPQPFKKKLADDAGMCFFDADGDNDPDLFIAGGGFENSPGSFAYRDHFYRNNGQGDFTYDSAAIPKNYSSKSCVRPSDYDNDGDIDLFIGGRVLPGSYPTPVSSFIYNNDGKGNFTDVTETVAAGLKNIGMVTDATWSDNDNDGDPDLVITGEWMPLTILENDKGRLTKTSHNLQSKTGWFNSIAAADLDNDGDMDYVLGNYGRNGFYQPSEQYPIRVYGKDFDANGSFDAVLSTWLPPAPGEKKTEYPSASRDELIKEMTYMKGRFGNYNSYAQTKMAELFTVEELKGVLQLSANYPLSVWIENKGNFRFDLHELPAEAQWGPVFGMVINDFNQDGNLDIVLSGNDYGMSPMLGRNDALNGILMTGNGKGGFAVVPLAESGVYLPGDGKALVQLIAGNKLLLAASQNQDQLKLFAGRQEIPSVHRPLPGETTAILTLKNGQHRKVEFYGGSSFLSQSSAFIITNKNISRIEFVRAGGQKRTVQP